MDIIISGNEKIMAFLYGMQPLWGEKLQCGAEIRKELAALSRASDARKPSAFNYHVECDGRHMVYNAMYNTLARMTKMEYEKLLGLRPCGKELANLHLMHGLSVPKDLDERQCYETGRQMHGEKVHHFSLNITTTLKCNARCAYCYEKGVVQHDFQQDMLPKLIAFIKRKKKKAPVLLNWFGGEPLMNTTMLDAVSKELTDEKIAFKSYLITNGSLLTKKMVREKFPQWNMKDVQITLDGMPDEYEARKAYVGKRKDVFKKLMEHIAFMAEYKILVHIRLNIDRENRASILQLMDVLHEQVDALESVTYYPAFLTGNENKLTEEEKVRFLKEMFHLLRDPQKMSMGNRMYAMPRPYPCMRNDPGSYSVDIHGNVYNCEHLVGRSELAMGTLSRMKPHAAERRREIVFQEECETCPFLPKCMGGCAANFETQDAPCMIEKYMIQAYIEMLA